MRACLTQRPCDEAEGEGPKLGASEDVLSQEAPSREAGDARQEDPPPPLAILIAEDEFLIALSLKASLQREGYQVVGVAGTGREAVELARRKDPDVVLMDVQMPEMTGLEATRRLMEESPTCVVVLTAYAGSGPAAEAAGAMGCVLKPLMASQMARTFARARRRFAQYLEILGHSTTHREALERWLQEGPEIE